MTTEVPGDRERVAVRVGTALTALLALASPWVDTGRPLHPAATVLLALAVLPWLVAALGVRMRLGGLRRAAVVLPVLSLPPLTVLHLAGGPLGLIDGTHDMQLTFMIVTLLVGFVTSVASRRVAVAVALWGLALPVGRGILETEFPGWPFWLVGVLAGVSVGLVGRHQLRLVDRLRQAQAALAHQAALEERRRIAREVHDVVAHSLTVTMLHLGAARLALGPDNEEAAEALSEAERCGRQSLNDIRRTVGLLRAGNESATEAALPHASEIGQLVERWGEAGLEVTLHVDGELAGLGPTDGLVVYRVVQEALSNVAKHAPGAEARVRVQIGGGQARVQVEDDGARSFSRHQAEGAGLGLQGMQERVELLDGRLEAGPRGEGWVVEAVIDLHDGGRPPSAAAEQHAGERAE
jgi:signal transduction histidine kinase